jgi:hypothetical protein
MRSLPAVLFLSVLIGAACSEGGGRPAGDGGGPAAEAAAGGSGGAGGGAGGTGGGGGAGGAVGGAGGTAGRGGTGGSPPTMDAGGGQPDGGAAAMGTQPLGSICANTGNCSQAGGMAVCCMNTCTLADMCPSSPGYLPCAKQADCDAFGGGKICCEAGGMRFCTKQSACTGRRLP